MTKYLAGIAALGFVGLAAMPVTATAAENQSGLTNASVQLTDVSSQRRWHRRYVYRHYYGPRRYYGPRYGYYGYGYPYSAYGYPYRYYRPGPAVSFGIGPFGFGVF